MSVAAARASMPRDIAPIGASEQEAADKGSMAIPWPDSYEPRSFRLPAGPVPQGIRAGDRALSKCLVFRAKWGRCGGALRALEGA